MIQILEVGVSGMRESGYEIKIILVPFIGGVKGQH